MNQKDRTHPVTLGRNLALITSLVVTLGMGSITAWQQRQDISREWQARQASLEASMIPLKKRILNARDMASLRGMLMDFHQAYLEHGDTQHQLELRDKSGRLQFKSWATSHPRSQLHVITELRSPLFVGGAATLELWHDDAAFLAWSQQRWRGWWVHLFFTVLIILATLLLCTRWLFDRPLARLIASIKRMELGYWDLDSSDRGPAELQFLAGRFASFAHSHQQSMKRLLEAERRASEDLSTESRTQSAWSPGSNSTARRGDETGTLERNIGAQLAELADPALSTSERRQLALSVWCEAAPTAERQGLWALQENCERSALRVLDPQLFERIEQEHQQQGTQWNQQLEQISSALEEALAQHGLASFEVSHRLKRPASVWRKMRTKDLRLDQIYDRLAVRIVVTNEASCYQALGVAHARFEPLLERFKDYIAEPKGNGYQSLHTTLRGEDAHIFELQIRSRDMHQRSEHGQGSHWQYSKSSSMDASSLDTHFLDGRPHARAWWRRWFATRNQSLDLAQAGYRTGVAAKEI